MEDIKSVIKAIVSDEKARLADEAFRRVFIKERIRRFAKVVRHTARTEPPKVQWWLSKMLDETMYNLCLREYSGEFSLIWTPKVMYIRAWCVIEHAQACTQSLPDAGFEKAA